MLVGRVYHLPEEDKSVESIQEDIQAEEMIYPFLPAHLFRSHSLFLFSITHHVQHHWHRHLFHVPTTMFSGSPRYAHISSPDVTHTYIHIHIYAHTHAFAYNGIATDDTEGTRGSTRSLDFLSIIILYQYFQNKRRSDASYFMPLSCVTWAKYAVTKYHDSVFMFFPSNQHSTFIHIHHSSPSQSSWHMYCRVLEVLSFRFLKVRFASISFLFFIRSRIIQTHDYCIRTDLPR